jgi:Asp-tRNA(Asn)/Glu-tRNA(Gln) amidotransferase A subunit family amidase
VAQLRACGAVLAGKTNMHELGAGTSGINPHHGSTRNPYDTGRVSGGSSGGSAAAVCAGLCPVALGADGGGAHSLTFSVICPQCNAESYRDRLTVLCCTAA